MVGLSLGLFQSASFETERLTLRSADADLMETKCPLSPAISLERRQVPDTLERQCLHCWLIPKKINRPTTYSSYAVIHTQINLINSNR